MPTFQKKSYKSLIFNFSIEKNTLFFGLDFSVSTTEFRCHKNKAIGAIEFISLKTVRTIEGYNFDLIPSYIQSL